MHMNNSYNKCIKKILFFSQSKTHSLEYCTAFKNILEILNLFITWRLYLATWFIKV